MFGLFKIKKDKPKRTLLKTSRNGFSEGILIVKITDKELETFSKVYERSGITLLVK